MALFRLPKLCGAEVPAATSSQRGTWTGVVTEVGLDVITMTLTSSSENDVSIPITKPSELEFYGSTGFTLDGNTTPTRGLVGLLKAGVSVTLHWNGERSRDLRLFHAVETGRESATSSISSSPQKAGVSPETSPKAPLPGDRAHSEPERTISADKNDGTTKASGQDSPPMTIPGFQAYPLDPKWTGKLNEKPGNQRIEDPAFSLESNEETDQRPQMSDKQASRTIPPPHKDENMKLPKRKSLGLQVYQLDQAMAKKLDLGQQSGFVVEMVSESSPAAEAGLQRGDIIVEISGKLAKSAELFDDAVSRWRGGERLELTILRQKNLIDPPERLSLCVGTNPE